MIGRSVFSAGMIRVDVLRILRVILMLMMALGMGVLNHNGRTNVSDRAKKSGKHQQPTCQDGVKAVLFTGRHGENQMKFQPTFKSVAAAISHPGSVWQDFVRVAVGGQLETLLFGGGCVATGDRIGIVGPRQANRVQPDDERAGLF